MAKKKSTRRAADPAAKIASLESRKQKLDLQIQIQKLKEQYRQAGK